MATRRHFTQEYKDQAVSLVLDSGRPIAEVARSIGVHEMTLGKWVKKARESGRAQDKDLSETERAELERLPPSRRRRTLTSTTRAESCSSTPPTRTPGTSPGDTSNAGRRRRQPAGGSSRRNSDSTASRFVSSLWTGLLAIAQVTSCCFSSTAGSSARRGSDQD